MAEYTDDQIMQLRRMIGDDVQPYQYDDTTLIEYLDASLGDFNTTASKIWWEKAGTYSSSVDITEAGSSRKNSDLFDHAMKMAQYYDGVVNPEPEPIVPASTTRRIVRR